MALAAETLHATPEDIEAVQTPSTTKAAAFVVSRKKRKPGAATKEYYGVVRR